MNFSRGYAILFLMLLIFFIPGVYGVQITASGGGNGESGSVSMNFDTLKSTAVSSQMTIDGADITPSVTIAGRIPKFEQTHAVKDKSGKSASVYVKVVNAPLGLDYRSEVLPREGNLITIEPWISAEQWLTVPKADSIKCTATASYGKLSADVGIEEVKGRSSGDYVTLTGYDGKAYASATQVEASQTAISGEANSIKIYGNAKDSIGLYSVNTQLNGISGGKAGVERLNDLSSAGTAIQAVQTEHVYGTFTSKATYKPVKGTTITKTRTSNYGTEYDLNMQANKLASGPPSVTGILGYYINPTMKIQGAVNAAQSGDTINAATGTYLEDININKYLTLKGIGNPTATSFALNAILGTGSGGITAPIVNVNPGGSINDGLVLAADAGLVKVAAGNYLDNVNQDFYSRNIQLSGIAGSTITNQITLNQPVAGKISGIMANTVNVNPNAKIQDGVDLASQYGTVKVGIGTYYENILIDKALTVSGAGAGDDPTTNTIVDGNLAGSVFTIGKTAPSVDVALSGMTIKNGKATDGGGIYNSGALDLNGIMVIENAAQRGGGIYNQVYGTVNMNSGSSITGNTAYDGGGILNYGITTLEDSSITGNTASFGGGIENYGTVYMYAGSIGGTLPGEGNTAKYQGGGIYNDRGTVNMNSGSSISGNTAEIGQGGGIHNQGYGTVNVYAGSSITSNEAGDIGGGISNSGTVNLNAGSSIAGNRAIRWGGGIGNWGTVNMDSGSISGNTANSGGGIYSYAGIVNLDGGSISGNTADGEGGGISNRGTVTMNGGSITDNTANQLGGGIYNIDGAVTMNGGSITGNTANGGGGICNYNSAMTMNGGSITDNTANSVGGGIYNWYNSAVTMNGGSITDNTANSVGGGIYNYYNSAVNMNGGSITGNTAYGGGGGIFNDNSAVNMNEGSITGNTAYGGGGILNFAGTVTMNGGSITDNTANQLGGGIYNYNSAVNMNGGSITDNTAIYNGGGIYSYFGIVNMNSGSITGNMANNYGGGIYSKNTWVTFDGTQVVVKSNKAHWPDSESSWYQGWGVYLESGIPTTTGGFDPITQVTGNTHI